HGNPAVDLRGFDSRVRLSRGKRQPDADEDALHHVVTHRSCVVKEDEIDDECDAYCANECREVESVCSAHIFLFITVGLAASAACKGITGRELAVVLHEGATGNEHCIVRRDYLRVSPRYWGPVMMVFVSLAPVSDPGSRSRCDRPTSTSGPPW